MCMVSIGTLTFFLKVDGPNCKVQESISSRHDLSVVLGDVCFTTI